MTLYVIVRVVCVYKASYAPPRGVCEGKKTGFSRRFLSGCSSLTELPAAIGGRKGLTVNLPLQLMADSAGPLLKDLAALRKLRDDDASGAIKENVGSDEDPRKWRRGYVVTVSDGRVTKLSLNECKVVALPAAIGELGALA